MKKRSFLTLATLLMLALSVSAQHTYNEVTLPELMKKVKEGKDIIILDVRTRGEHHDTLSNNKHLNIGRIKGAVNIPIQDLTQKPEAIKQIEGYKDKEIYVICSHSYRSRTISNLLLQNGFTNVNNVQGGMSEWFRDYNGLAPYRNNFYERKIAYKNISPAEIFDKLSGSDEVTFIGVSTNPRFAFDSMMVNFYDQFPALKKTNNYKLTDSSTILEKAIQASGKPIVLYNIIGSGGGEMADWLTKKGVPNVHFLYGNAIGFYEYLLNYRKKADVNRLFETKTRITFYTPLSFCTAPPKNMQFIDQRHDTLFNKMTNGTKLTYKSLKDAVNFPFYRSIEEFEKTFPDKSKHYVFAPHQNYGGIGFAKQLTERGYSIGWIIGGNERWEWYANNVREFKCGEMLQ